MRNSFMLLNYINSEKFHSERDLFQQKMCDKVTQEKMGGLKNVRQMSLSVCVSVCGEEIVKVKHELLFTKIERCMAIINMKFEKDEEKYFF